MRRPSVWVGCVLLATALGGAPHAVADTYRVKATAADEWKPDFRHIVVGDRIAWKNPADLDTLHDVKSYGKNWDMEKVNLSPGEVHRKRFKRPGSFRYRCTIHSNLENGTCSGMCGLIHVVN